MPTPPDEVLQLASALVGVDSRSPTPGEREIADLLSARAKGRGFGVSEHEAEDGRTSLVISADAGPGPMIALCGHLDTKPLGSAEGLWLTNPYELTVQDGKAFGLGAADMKGGVAAMILAFEDCMLAPDAVGRASLVLTADEECGSTLGAKYLAESGALDDLDAVVIGEPSGIRSSWEALHVVSRGICCFEISIQAKQGHSGLSQYLGPGAIEIASDIVRALRGLDELLPSSPFGATVNPAVRISGGVGFGIIPGDCLLSAEIRVVPGMERETIWALVTSTVLAVAGDRAQVSFLDGPLGWTGATSVSEDSPLVEVAQQACQGALGRRLPLAAYPGGTDGSFIAHTLGVPTIASLGPGLLSSAHGPNEWVSVDDLPLARALYRELLWRGVRMDRKAFARRGTQSA